MTSRTATVHAIRCVRAFDAAPPCRGPITPAVMPDYPDAAYVTLAPDRVCEVLSPSTRKLDLHGKRPIYA